MTSPSNAAALVEHSQVTGSEGHPVSSLLHLIELSRSRLVSLNPNVPPVVSFVVGSETFAVARNVIEKDPQSLLFLLCDKHFSTSKSNQPIEIPGRDPTCFRYLLNLLRGYQHAIPDEWKSVCEGEAYYYGLDKSWRERFGKQVEYEFRLPSGTRLFSTEKIRILASDYFDRGIHSIKFAVHQDSRLAVGVTGEDALEEPDMASGCALYWFDGRITSVFSNRNAYVRNSGHPCSAKVVEVVLDSTNHTVYWKESEQVYIDIIRLPDDRRFAFCCIVGPNSEVSLVE